MITQKVIKTLEYDKIAEKVSSFAVLETSKRAILSEEFNLSYDNAKFLLDKTNEAYNLYLNGVKGVVYFDEIFDELNLAEKLSTLTPSSLLKVARLLRSARITSSEVIEFSQNGGILYDIACRIFFDNYLENEIFSKIVNEDEVSDNASEKLRDIRKNIKRINERIREKLQGYMRSGANKYLQDNVVSMRNGRYVVPVKSEYLSSVKGFVHDRSASGSTFFIEPQEVLDLNNELRREILAEGVEVERILFELTQKISTIVNNLRDNISLLTDIDIAFAKAEYSYKIKGVYPKLNSNGVIDIKKGRHPLIDQDKVVPISVNFGKDYNYLLISGPNTGGKTVTLKLIGLFVLMSAIGVFVPAVEGTIISVFDNIFCDIGDEQSIENSLSTFSSHVKNLKYFLDNANDKTLVLIDEIGAGTDPEEGSVLAQAILEKFISLNSFGVVTTHYTALKEFASQSNNIQNASMDFDANTFTPLYKVNIGTPGLSNAIKISSRLGISSDVLSRAKSLLSEDKVLLDNILAEAENSRIESENLKNELQELKNKEVEIYNALKIEREKFEKERENFLLKSKTEARKLINEKVEKAEELLDEIKSIFSKQEFTQTDIVKVATLKNKLINEKYNAEKSGDKVVPYQKVDISSVKVGDEIYVKSLDDNGTIIEVNERKGFVWALVGSIKINVKKCDIYLISKNNSKTQKPSVSIKRQNVFSTNNEINVIGKNLDDALLEVEKFLDTALLSNLEEVKIVHGKGMNILSSGIRDMLKKHRAVDSFRSGKYGEGENGVTIVKLK